MVDLKLLSVNTSIRVEIAHATGDIAQIICLSQDGAVASCFATPGFLPGESHGQRSLAGYCPWDRKESDTAEAT